MLFPEEMIISEIFLLKAECKQAFCHVFGRPIRYNNHDPAEFLKNIAEMKGVIIMKKIIGHTEEPRSFLCFDYTWGYDHYKCVYCGKKEKWHESDGLP